MFVALLKNRIRMCYILTFSKIDLMDVLSSLLYVIVSNIDGLSHPKFFKMFVFR